MDAKDSHLLVTIFFASWMQGLSNLQGAALPCCSGQLHSPDINDNLRCIHDTIPMILIFLVVEDLEYFPSNCCNILPKY